MNVSIIIPFRDRGKDPLRPANLQRCLKWWENFGAPVIVADDGNPENHQFNRSKAYNRGAAKTSSDIMVFVESDTLVPYKQIHDAIDMAAARPGMIVPFTHQKKLTTEDSVLVRELLKEPEDCIPGRHPYGEKTNYGCANVLSRETLRLVGQWDEVFMGHGHDDNAMYHAFDVVANPVRWVDGPCYHLYHLDFDPDTAPDKSYLSKEDIDAQERNRRRLEIYRKAKTPEEIRKLTSGQEFPENKKVSLNWKERYSANTLGVDE